MSDNDNDPANSRVISDRTRCYEKATIERALAGDAEAGREALRNAISAIDARRWDSPALPYLTEQLLKYLDHAIPLARALCVEEKKRGGAPRKHGEREIAAADILLRDYAGYKPEQANTWLREQTGIDRTQVQDIRKAYDSRYNTLADKPLADKLPYDFLLHCAPNLRENLLKVLPQTQD